VALVTLLGAASAERARRALTAADGHVHRALGLLNGSAG
jgi:hypothetical protein